MPCPYCDDSGWTWGADPDGRPCRVPCDACAYPPVVWLRLDGAPIPDPDPETP